MKRKIYKKYQKIKNKLTKRLNLVTSFLCYFFIRFFIAKSIVKHLNSSIAGNYNFVNDRNFFKIVVYNKRFFKAEISNIAIIKKEFKPLEKFIDNYNYSFLKIFILVSSSRLIEPSNQKQYEFAEEILKSYNALSKKDHFEISLMPNVIKGIEIIEEIYRINKVDSISEIIINKLSSFLEKDLFNIGPCHGDFHSKNILHDQGNKIFLIDYDCFRSKSIQELDAIYFIVQKIIDDNPGIWWHEAIENFMEIYLPKNNLYSYFLDKFVKQDLNKIILLYYFDRLGQDFSYDNSIQNLNHKFLIKITEKLLNKFYATNNS